MKVTQAVQSWDQWVAGKLAPRSRREALDIVSKQLHIPLSALKNATSKAIHTDGREAIDSRLSLLVWDLTENGGRLFNYDRDSTLFANLLTQAGNFLYSYTRKSLKIGSKVVTLPTRVSTKQGATTLASMTPAKLEDLAQSFIREAQAMLSRWRIVAENAPNLLRKLRRVEEVLLEDYAPAQE